MPFKFLVAYWEGDMNAFQELVKELRRTIITPPCLYQLWLIRTVQECIWGTGQATFEGQIVWMAEQTNIFHDSVVFWVYQWYTWRFGQELNQAEILRLREEVVHFRPGLQRLLAYEV